MKKLTGVYQSLLRKSKEYNIDLTDELQKIAEILWIENIHGCTLEHKQHIKKLCQHHGISVTDFTKLNEIFKWVYSHNDLQRPNSRMRTKVDSVLAGNYLLPTHALNKQHLLQYTKTL